LTRRFSPPSPGLQKPVRPWLLGYLPESRVSGNPAWGSRTRVECLGSSEARVQKLVSAISAARAPGELARTLGSRRQKPRRGCFAPQRDFNPACAWPPLPASRLAHPARPPFRGAGGGCVHLPRLWPDVGSARPCPIILRAGLPRGVHKVPGPASSKLYCPFENQRKTAILWGTRFTYVSWHQRAVRLPTFRHMLKPRAAPPLWGRPILEGVTAWRRDWTGVRKQNGSEKSSASSTSISSSAKSS